MLSPSALVITSISPPNSILTACAEGCRSHGVDFIVVGDDKSPEDFQLEGCDFWSIEKQRKLPFSLARSLPERHYARKNLGYLIAMERGVETIIETDDDNLPFDSFWKERHAEQLVNVIAEQGWVNVYRHFTDEPIWPRGYPLELVQVPHVVLEGGLSRAYCPIQQGLADGNPDVDAVYRLIMPLPVSFRSDPPIALGKGCWSPFNSQNTTWFKPAFPLLYIPSYCSFRMCDIWRSFVATRICWENDWNVMFHESTVFQERNEHDLLHDFRDEIPGYLNNAQLCQALSELELRGGVECLADDLKTCYELLIKLGYIGAEEMPLVDAWLEDVSSLI
jgi:hypothetical protein